MGGCASKRPNSRTSKEPQILASTSSTRSDSSVPTASQGNKVRILSKEPGCTVHQLDNNQVVKSGYRVKPSEAKAMTLVSKYTDIPIPTFIKAEFDAKKKQGSLWMGFVAGPTLDVVWDKLGPDTKDYLCRDTWDMIEKIRQIPRQPECEPFYQCAADGSTTYHPLIGDLARTPRPIFNDSELRRRIHKRYLHFGGEQYAKELPNMLPRSSSSVFTHADIAPRNILVDESHRITGIIDWEKAGWYPRYWEYISIMGSPNRAHRDWQQWMDHTAPPHLKCSLAGINAARTVLF
jgi:Phosphotransferase enzyme family